MNSLETNAPERQSEESVVQRKPYVAPTMTDFGSVAELTRGAVNVGADAGIYS